MSLSPGTLFLTNFVNCLGVSALQLRRAKSRDSYRRVAGRVAGRVLAAVRITSVTLVVISPPQTPKESFEAIFCLKNYFYFLRFFLKTLQKYPLKQA